MEPIKRQEPQSAHPVCLLGFLFVALGIGVTGYAYLRSGAPAQVPMLNLGLLNDKLILAIAGSTLFLAGLFLVVSGVVLKHLGMLSGIGHGGSGLPAVGSASAGEPLPIDREGSLRVQRRAWAGEPRS